MILPHLATLNSQVSVNLLPPSADLPSALATGQFTMVLLANASPHQLSSLLPQARASLTKAVVAECRGLFGRVFVDVGMAHEVWDADGVDVAPCAITALSLQAGALHVHVAGDTPHGLSQGQALTFSDFSGPLAALNGTKHAATSVPNRTHVTVALPAAALSTIPPSADLQTCGGYLTAVKTSQTLSGYSWEAAHALRVSGSSALIPNAAADLLADSLVDEQKPPAVSHALWWAAHQHFATTGSWPEQQHATAVAATAEAFLAGLGGGDGVVLAQPPAAPWGPLLPAAQAFCSAMQALLSPAVSILGGFAAHEVVKVLTGKTTPTKQWWYWDAREVVAAPQAPCATPAPLHMRSCANDQVLGTGHCSTLANARVFLVGAGAIGCEMLKVLACLGVGTGPNGHITVTDMDTIERSNLSRQFLFRPHHVGQSKASVAAAAAVAMNPALTGKVTALSEAVGGDSDGPFTDTFWGALDLVIPALDNVPARTYVDCKCVQHCLPMFDSGTVGSMGSTQPVLPHLTLNWAATHDPPQASFPVCTLKNFPYRIEHTVQWAQDWFHGAFTASVSSTQQYLSGPSAFLSSLPSSSRLHTVQEVQRVLSATMQSPLDCVAAARRCFEELFCNSIRQLLTTYPASHVSEHGVPFWSGQKRLPHPLEFSVSDASHVAFVLHVARMFAKCRGIDWTTLTADLVASAVHDVDVPDFTPDADMAIAADDSELAQQVAAAEVAAASGSVQAQVDAVVAALPPPEAVQANLHPLHFDKDDDDMMAAVASAANLRAANYSIPAVDLPTSRRIAGNIVPAVATTTAVVAGMAAVEALKWTRGIRDVAAFRSLFMNMALPVSMLAEPMPCPVTETALPAGVPFVPPGATGVLADTTKERVWGWTLWDVIRVPGPATLGDIVQRVESTFGLTVSMVNVGVACLYSDMMHTPARLAEKACMEVAALVESVTGEAMSPDVTELELMVIAVDEAEAEVEVPTVKYTLPATRQHS